MEFKAFLKKHRISSKNIAAIYGRGYLTDFKHDWLIYADRIKHGSGVKITIYCRSTLELIDSWGGDLTPHFQKKFRNW